MSNNNPWIQLSSGAKFDLVDLESNEFKVLDLAQGISKLCRFGGACTEFYSVAQHSVLCAVYAPEHLKYQALMHDIHETITGDMPSPIKRNLPDYREFENRIAAFIRRRLDLPIDLDPLIHEIDMRMLVTEKRDIMAKCEHEWSSYMQQFDPYEDKITPWRESIALIAFMQSYKMFAPPRNAEE